MCNSKETEKDLVERLRTLQSGMVELERIETEHKRVNIRSHPYRITALMCYITAVFMTICLLTADAAGAQTEHAPKVLVLNSYHRGYYWSDNIMDAIRAEFDKTGLDVELCFEYMDTQRYKLSQVNPFLKQFYQTKYRDVQFDLIISSDDNALYFLLDHRDLLFPGVPIVFCGVQQIDEDDARKLSPITGVFERYDYESTMAIALKLHPLAGQIVVIHERTADSPFFQRNIASVVPKLDRAVELVSFSLAELSMAELLQKLTKLGDESVVLFEGAFKDREGDVYSLDDSLAMIDEHCAAPIYVTGFDMLGLGTVGGMLTNGSYQGEAAAKMAIRILNGESVRNIPVLRESPNAYMFDYIQLKHFGISLSELPAGSIVINEPQSFYYRHKGQVWAVIAIIAGLTAAVMILLASIVRRKRAEEALIQSEEKYRSVIENIGIGISVISPKMEILAINRQIKEWFPDIDVSKKPICYRAYNNPPRDDICSYCPTYKSLKDGQVHESITETPTGDKIMNYRIVSSPIKDKDGRVIAAIEMVEEITERKKAEEALRESEERYKALFQGAAEGILVADVDTREFMYANPAICRMLGYTEEELKQLSVYDIHPKEDLEYVISEFETQARGEKTLSSGIPCLRKDGTTIFADIDTAGVLIDGRRCNVGFFTNITERKRAEEELRKARDELEARVKQRTADLAKVNKELRKEIMERKKAKERLLDYQKQLRSLASELSLAEERLRRRIATGVHDHIGQNLAISKIKIESLQELLSSSEFSEPLEEIHDLVGQAIESTRSLTFELSPPVLYELGFEAAMKWLVRQTREQHGLSTDFRDDRQPKPLDNNVRVLLFQAVRELLVNVAKHAQAHNLEVSTRRVGNEIQVSVEDDGVGFDISETCTHGYKTSGFGLFSIRERLGHIGGHLDVESKPGCGTRVTLVAPIDHKDKNSKEKRK